MSRVHVGSRVVRIHRQDLSKGLFRILQAVFGQGLLALLISLTEGLFGLRGI